MPRRVLRLAAVLVALVVAPAGCTCAGSTFYVAQGVRDELPDWVGPCEKRFLSEPIRFDDPAASDGFEAVQAGDVSFACQKGRLTLRIRPIEQLEIQAPVALAPGRKVIVSARAYDAEGNPLRLGTSPVWSVEGGEPLDRCSHMLGSCLDASQLRLRAPEAGVVVLTVGVAGTTARRSVPVGPPP